MSVSEPGKIITPWAESGLKNTIPPAANPATGRAGFDQGFSAINMTAKEAGGIPPFGQDFNGIFYEVTNILRYMQAGGQPTFDAALAAAIGGYPKGAMVLGSDGVTLWQSKVDSNSTNPNTDPTDWGTFDIGLKADLAAPGGAGLVGFGSETVAEVLDSIFEKPSAGLLTIGGMNERQKLGFDLNGAEWTKDLAPVTPAAFKNLDNYCLTSGVFEGQLEITVGPGGDFPANGLTDAIAYASKFRPKYKNAGSNLHNRIDIKILSGVTITEGINARGLDLSHIRLTSVDPIVPVNFNNGLWWMYGEWQCQLPIIATIFDMQGIGFDGASVKMGSQLVVEYGQGKECGIINASRHNVFANTGCNVVLREGVFTGAGDTAIHLEKGCTGSAREAKCGLAGGHAIRLIQSDLDVYGIDAPGAGGFVILAEGGSTAKGFGINGAGSASGLRADNGSKIIAPSSTLTGIGATNAIAIADELSEIDVTGSTLSGGSAASLALFGGKVVLGAMNCTNTGAASSNIRVLSGGLTFATGATGTTSITPNAISPNGIIFK